jgi:glutamate/tyrosine decarboxylase-like PLP-dependent enzyme
MKELFSYVLDRANQLKTAKLSEPKSPEELASKFNLELGEPTAEKKLKDLIDSIFEESVNTQNPRFLNQLYGGSTEASWLGELLVSILNTSMATYEIAPLATMMEKELVRALNIEVGFSKVGGIMAPGGSYANMLGLQCARFEKAPEVKTKGLYGFKRFMVFASEDAHYSTEKALGLMGLGVDSLVTIKVDEKHRIDVKDLSLKIEKCKSEGFVPLCVVSTAGTTVWGAFDPIDEIDELCKEHEIWHHVDAAWGGLALWSDKKDRLFKGLSKVDSITIDFHKLLASTLTKAIFLTQKPNVLTSANSGGGTKYIFHRSDEDEASYDTGTYSLQCGRKVDSLPVWLQWKMGGTEQFFNKSKELYSYVDKVVEKIQNHRDLKLLLSPEYMNICFQILPKDPTIEVGEYNRKARELLMSRGRFMVNFSKDDVNGAFFRLVLSHWSLTEEILQELFEELEVIKRELDA